MAKLTHQQKLDALAYRFYQGAAWGPKAGDFYTTSRADLELYQVVSVEGGVVRTRFTEGSDAISEWPEGEFLTSGFGPKRVFVPEWIICAKPAAGPWQPIETAPGMTDVLVWWPLVKLDDDGDPTDEVTGGGAFVSELQGNYWIEPDALNAMGDHMGDDETYADGPSHWMPLPAAPNASGGQP